MNLLMKHSLKHKHGVRLANTPGNEHTKRATGIQTKNLERFMRNVAFFVHVMRRVLKIINDERRNY